VARDYELVLMLDPTAPDERREALAGETQKQIESAGSLKHAEGWGTRKLAYEIRQRTEADYRFYRFEAGSDLLDQLDHTLKISDGVLRFRIFKVDDRTSTNAPPPTAQPAGVSARAARAERRAAEPGPAPGAEAEPAETEPEAEPAATEPEEAEPAPAEPEPAQAPEAQAEGEPAESGDEPSQ
jgi:small subunit ribosomal protein S6